MDGSTYDISTYDFVFSQYNIMSNILSFVSEDKLQGIVSNRLVSKDWDDQCRGLMNHKWNVIKKDPQLLPFMSDLESKPVMEKFKILASRIGVKLHNVEMSAESFKRAQNDVALQKIWTKDLRKKLEQLDVQHLPDLNASAHDIRQFLQNCNQLNQITILDVSAIGLTVIPPEFNLLTGLQRLSLESNQISKIENLDNVPQLEALYLQSNQISKIENLDNVPQLHTLSLKSNQISKIENLDNVPQLEALYLQSNQIFKIENLDNVPQLQWLYLESNQIFKIENLDNVPQLEVLSLESNQISKIENLDNVPQLEVLYLESNQIFKIENLDNVPQLEVLSLESNQISKIENLDNVPQLHTLRLNSNNPYGNILMSIPESVLERFNNVDEFKLFKKQLNYNCISPLANIYQAIMKNINPIKLKELFLSLEEEEKMGILEIVKKRSGISSYQSAARFIGMESRRVIEQTLAFKDFDLFCSAVQETVLQKFQNLAPEEKNKVYRRIYELAGSPETDDLQWGEHHCTENMPRLADALAGVSVK